MAEANPKGVGRRALLRWGVLSAGVLSMGLEHLALHAFAQGQARNPFAGGKLLGTVDFIDEGRPDMEMATGEELDGRLFTDLSAVGPDAGTDVTPTAKFYLRTRASKLLPDPRPWKVKIDGLVDKPSQLSVEELRKRTKSVGVHLMECSGNARFAHFGLISVAKWTGVPVAEVLEAAKAKPGATRALISGFDRYENKSASSVAGASWIFTPQDLTRWGAFLAMEMNDAPLTPDHGAPVRLVVPGWYGCTCIKWVNTITLVGDDAEATSQMQEYAARTHQKGVPALAKDYEPAVIDQAAMPVRVENWQVNGKIRYRVVGILWGGTQPVKVLQIRFNPEEDYVPVDYFSQSTNDPWSFWTHAWSPREPGTYSIRLMVKEPAVRTRRLDSGYYVRTVEINEV